MRKSALEFFKYVVITLLFFVFHLANIQGVYFFATSILVALIYVGENPVLLAPIWGVTAFLSDFDFSLLITKLTFIAILLASYYILVLLKKRISLPILGGMYIFAYSAQIVFAILNPALRANLFLEISLGLIALFCFALALDSIKRRGVRKVMPFDDLLCFCVLIFSIAVGICCVNIDVLFYCTLAFGVLLSA